MVNHGAVAIDRGNVYINYEGLVDRFADRTFAVGMQVTHLKMTLPACVLATKVDE